MLLTRIGGGLAKIWGKQEDGGRRNVFKETERMKIITSTNKYAMPDND